MLGMSELIAGRVRKAIGKNPRVTFTCETDDSIILIGHFRRHRGDVVIIDVGDMAVEPLVTLKRLKNIDPNVKVILISTLTFANVKRGMEGLMRGAAEYIQTPAAHTKRTSESEFASHLNQLIEAFGKHQAPLPRTNPPPAAELAAGTANPTQRKRADSAPLRLRTAPKRRPAAIAIASSTGGPQALFTLFENLPRTIGLPIFITQHMPATFTKALAEHLARRTGWPCTEGKDAEAVKPDQAYLAPGNYHMTTERHAGQLRIRLNQDPQENFCRPSADPMIRSLVDAYGAENLLVVVLTGMGSDGRQSATMAADNGAHVIAQDEESSVVWGMPGAVARAGICSQLLPIGQIARYIAKAAKG